MFKKKILYRSSLVLLALLTVLLIAMGIYVSDYYRAEKSVGNYINQGLKDGSIMYGSKEELIFYPREEQDLHVGIIFYPGGKVAYQAYAPFMGKLAERGITCFLIKMPCNLAILNPKKADGLQEQFPEIEEWYMAGHSLGGACGAMYLEDRDESFEGLILLGAYSTVDLSSKNLQVLSLYGSKDGVLDLEKYKEDRMNLPTNLKEYVIEGGCHAGFGNYGEQSGDGKAEISNEKQQEIAADQIIEWIQNK